MLIVKKLNLIDKKLLDLKLYKYCSRNLTTTSEPNDDSSQLKVETKAPIIDEDEAEETKIDGFRVFELYKKTERKDRIRRSALLKAKYIRPERYRSMPVDQDWTNIWPSSSIFKQSVVPLPVHQGFIKNLAENEGIPPGKYANAELMKIPNFLHLTPPHIKKHCAAIKKFCTPWPELVTDEDCRKNFPIEITTTDYVYAGPSIRDERSRVVTLKVPIDALELDKHAKDKLIRLAENRYDHESKYITITSDRCPYRQQNYDYVKYLLNVLFYESWKTENWESELTEDDWSEYLWDKSKSNQTINSLTKTIDKNQNPTEVEKKVKEYAISVTNLFNTGESKETINSYKNSVLKLLNIKKKPEQSTSNAN